MNKGHNINRGLYGDSCCSKCGRSSEDIEDNGGECIVMFIELDGVAEYSEEMSVSLRKTDGKHKTGIPKEQCVGFGRTVIHAKNEAGFNCTEVDLEHLLNWLAHNRPEQYMKYVTTDMMIHYT